jgi:hypothetical protein
MLMHFSVRYELAEVWALGRFSLRQVLAEAQVLA